jgi:hypothetical protein
MLPGFETYSGRSNNPTSSGGRFFATTFKPFGEVKPIRTVNEEQLNTILEIGGYPWDAPKPHIMDTITALPILPITGRNTFASDEDLLTVMFSAKNGPKMRSVYDGDTSEYKGDGSSADMALVSALAFYSGRDASTMKRIWESSPMGQRPKVQGTRPDYTERTIEKAILKCDDVYTPPAKKTKAGDKASASTRLVESIINDDTMELFHDQYRDAFIRMPIDNHFETLNIASGSFKEWFSKTYYHETGTVVGNTALTDAINALKGKAKYDNPEYELKNRVAKEGEDILWDLSNDAWQVVRVNKDGWKIEDKAPILFRRFNHQAPQVLPVLGGELAEVLNFLNIQDEDQKILFMVWLVSLFIPGFAHPIPNIFGPMGTGKSSFSKIIRRIADPSQVEVLIFPKNSDELAQQLAHFYVAFYDNIHSLSQELSDVICQMVTGGGISKRKLFTDAEDVIVHIMANVGLNGISLVSDKPDLLARSILFELSVIDDSDRRDENEMIAAFEAARPRILGAIFTAVSGAMGIKDEIILDTKYRMSDFCSWGAAIANVIGVGQDNFLAAYKRNLDQQDEMIIEDDLVASNIIRLMDPVETKNLSVINEGRYEGTAAQLLKELNGSDYLDNQMGAITSMPKVPAELGRHLNKIKLPLQGMGIYMSKGRNDKRTRTIIIEKKNK